MSRSHRSTLCFRSDSTPNPHSSFLLNSRRFRSVTLPLWSSLRLVTRNTYKYLPYSDVIRMHRWRRRKFQLTACCLLLFAINNPQRKEGVQVFTFHLHRSIEILAELGIRWQDTFKHGKRNRARVSSKTAVQYICSVIDHNRYFQRTMLRVRG